MFTEDWLLERMTFWIPLLLSLTVHEWAHAWSAYRLGDVTAEREGRLTLNPLAHMDPIGTLLLPLIMPIGWAKPVPVNIGLFRRQVGPRAGILLVAAAGPISNLLIAVLSLLMLLVFVACFGNPASVPAAIYSLLDTCIWLNVLLAVFNMIPVHPLDGSRIADALMPDRFRGLWDTFCGQGPATLVVLLVLLVMVGGEFIMWPIDMTQQAVYTLVEQVTWKPYAALF